MSYDNYIKIFNPKVLILEDAKLVLDGIERLKDSNSQYIDVLKYALTSSRKRKQLKYLYNQKNGECK